MQALFYNSNAKITSTNMHFYTRKNYTDFGIQTKYLEFEFEIIPTICWIALQALFVIYFKAFLSKSSQTLFLTIGDKILNGKKKTSHFDSTVLNYYQSHNCI